MTCFWMVKPAVKSVGPTDVPVIEAPITPSSVVDPASVIDPKPVELLWFKMT